MRVCQAYMYKDVHTFSRNRTGLFLNKRLTGATYFLQANSTKVGFVISFVFKTSRNVYSGFSAPSLS